MGTDRNRKRLERIEGSLTPQEIVASLIEEFAKFDSIDDYAAWVAEDPSRKPLHRMHRQIESGVSRHQDGGGKNSSRALPRNRSSEVLFLYYLLLGANEHVLDFLRWEEFRVPAINASIQGVSEQVYSGMAAFELWKGLADTSYPLEADIVTAVSSALGNDIASFAALAFEIADRKSNDLAGQAANEEASSESTCDRLKRALHDLCGRGLVKRGSSVRLGPSPIGFLADAPLVDGVWIDQVAIELAEFAMLLCERGIDFELSEPHPLAPLRPCRRKEISGEQGADAPREEEITSAHAEAAARLSTFTGRTKEIDARPYFHLDDYRAWSGRKAGDDLEVTEGVVTASWNAWVEARGDNPELAGIRVNKLDPGLEEEDYFACKNPERRRRREEIASLTRTLMLDSNEVSKIVGSLEASRVGICSLLNEVGATVIATQRLTARHFLGRKIVFKSYANNLNELAERAELLAHDYNQLAHYLETNQNRITLDGKLAGQIKKIARSATDQAAEERAAILVSRLIASARAQMLSAIDQSEWAARIFKPFVTGEADLREPRV